MEFKFKIKNNNFFYQIKNLESKETKDFYVFYNNFNNQEIEDDVLNLELDKLINYIDNLKKSHFQLFIFNKKDNTFIAFNDKVASDNIFYHNSNNELIVSNDIKAIYRELKIKPNFDKNSLYNFLIYNYSISPKTIYENIYNIGIGEYFYFANKKVKYSRYWNLDKRFNPKKDNYQNLLKELENNLFKSIKEDGLDDVITALSGGIDSGGLIGMLHKLTDKNIGSITIGPYGKNSFDLKSSRNTIEKIKSKNIEIYPEILDLKKIKFYFKGLNEPLDTPFIVWNGLIIDKAKKLGKNKVLMGHGTNMILGSQKINKFAYYVGMLEKYIPYVLLKPFYLILIKLKNLSQNQRDILLTRSWEKRYSLSKAPIQSFEKKYFNNKFKDDFIDKINPIFKKSDLKVIDKVTLTEICTLGMYKCTTQFFRLGKKQGVIPISPFHNPTVLEDFVSVSDRIKKMNNWDKQIIRDVFKPYITEELFKNRPKSCILPYDAWFEKDNNYKHFINYLKTNKIVKDLIDLNKYQKNYLTIPSRGYSLVRLVGLAVWYDVNWNKKNIINFDKIFDKIND